MNPTITPEFLYLLAGDPVELAQTVVSVRTADVAELLAELEPRAAAQVVAALPLDLSVQIFDHPELEDRLEIFRCLPREARAPLLDAMSSDEQATMLREMDREEREQLLPLLARETRAALALILGYPPETAGGIMTTEFVVVPGHWTVETTLRHISQVGRTKETVYAIYIVDETELAGRTMWVSLRDPAGGAERRRATATSRSTRSRARHRRAARGPEGGGAHHRQVQLTGACPWSMTRGSCGDRHGGRRDRRRRGGGDPEDVQKSAAWRRSMSLPRAPLTAMVRKRGGLADRLFLGEMLTATAMGHYEARSRSAVYSALFVPLIISSGGNSGSQAATLIIRALALGEVRLRDCGAWPAARSRRAGARHDPRRYRPDPDRDLERVRRHATVEHFFSSA